MGRKWKYEIPFGCLKNSVLTNKMISYVGKKLKGVREGEVKLGVPISYPSLSKDLVSFDPKNETQAELITHLKIILSNKNVTDAELRVRIPGDFGRDKAITWVYWTK